MSALPPVKTWLATLRVRIEFLKGLEARQANDIYKLRVQVERDERAYHVVSALQELAGVEAVIANGEKEAS